MLRLRDQMLADAPSFEKLEEALVKMGRTPAETFVVQAGVGYPEQTIIFNLGTS
jgi:hypothetical protein